MFSVHFLRGENGKLKKTIPQQGGADIKCNSPFIPKRKQGPS